MAWTTLTLWNKGARELTVIHIHGTQEAIGEIRQIIKISKLKIHGKLKE